MQNSVSLSLLILLGSLCWSCTHDVETGSPSVTGPGKIASSDADQSDVEGQVKGKLKDLDLCYKQEKQRNPGAFGKILLSFNILADGRTEGVRLLASTLKSAVMEGCLVGKVEAWVFPRPAGGKPTSVRYPFSFQS